MPCTSIPYAVARVKVLEDKLINQDRIDRMLSANGAEGSFKVLLDSGYGGATAQSSREFESMIRYEMNNARALIDSITPDEELSDIFIMKYDYQNSKAYLKMRISSIDVPEAVSDAGKFDIAELKEMVYEQDTEGLPEHLADAIDETAKHMTLNPSPQTIDMMMDKAYMRWVMQVAKKKKNKFLLRYFVTKTDLTNIFMMLRVRVMDSDVDLLRQAFIDGGHITLDQLIYAYNQSDELVALQLRDTLYGPKLQKQVEQAVMETATWKFGKYMDDTLMSILKDYKDDIFKAEPVIGYFIAKENEAQVVRLIMTGKLNNMTEDTIRERLREIYV